MTSPNVMFTMLAVLLLANDLHVECRRHFSPVRSLWRKTRQLFDTDLYQQQPAIVFEPPPMASEVSMVGWPSAAVQLAPVPFRQNIYAAAAPVAALPSRVFGGHLALTSFGSFNPLTHHHHFRQPPQHYQFIRPGRSTPRNVAIAPATASVTAYYEPANVNPVPRVTDLAGSASSPPEAYHKPSRFDEAPFKMLTTKNRRTEAIGHDNRTPPMYTHNGAGGLSGSSSRANSNGDSLVASPDSSILPVYVLPPKNFQPIVYARPASTGGSIDRIDLTPTTYTSKGNPLAKTPEEYWYEESAGIIEQAEKKQQGQHPTKTIKSHSGYNKYNDIEAGGGAGGGSSYAAGVAMVSSEPAPKIEYVPSAELDADDADDIPVIEASTKNETRKAKKTDLTKTLTMDEKGNGETGLKRHKIRDYKTKLPVGLGSFLLGGIRGVNGRHWGMPAEVVKQLEFMPNASPITAEEKYHPVSNETRTTQPVAAAAAAAPEDSTDASELMSPVGDGVGEQEQHPEVDDKYEEGVKADVPSRFKANTIIDSEIDQEAQESRVRPSNVRFRPAAAPVLIAADGRAEKKL